MSPARTSIAVYVGTYRRNEPLRILLDSVARAADAVAERADVAMIVVDDNHDGSARGVVEQFEQECGDRFRLGVHYRNVGKGNISLVRNAGLETGMELATWVAMTDDDCEVIPAWLSEFLDCQERTGADAVTGPCVARVPEGSPAWLTDQPFLAEAMITAEDDAPMPVGATNNSMVRSGWFADHPTTRFDPDLGVVGGEDMVLFRQAASLGLRIHFAQRAVVHANEPVERTTFGYRVRVGYWLGNTMCVTNLALGSASRVRVALRGLKLAATTTLRPWRRLLGGQAPQWRYTVALYAPALGLVLGACGVRRAPH